ncbi:unnamed protein product, partial [marine sediment metagenome]
LSGICLFEEIYNDFTKEGISTDLITSFLSALLSFANEAFTDAIQHIQLSSRKILFELTKNVLFVAIVSAKTPVTDAEIKYTIRKIAKVFNKKFKSSFKDGSSGGKVSVFNSFSDDLRKIVKKEPLTLKFLTVEQAISEYQKQMLKTTQGYSKRIQEFQKTQMNVTKDYLEEAREHMLLSKREKRKKKLEDKSIK